MPKPKTVPTREGFEWFKRGMERREFREISPEEFSADMRQLHLRAPSPRTGREVGFRFEWSDGLDVTVWTTFIQNELIPREKDTGWVLIRKHGRKMYSREVRRTKHFFKNLLTHAAIARRRIMLRRRCPVCFEFLQIAFGRHLKSRYWRCRSGLHQKVIGFDWDFGMPPEAVAFLKPIRKRKQLYREGRRKNGRPLDAAMKKRRGWQPRTAQR